MRAIVLLAATAVVLPLACLLVWTSSVRPAPPTTARYAPPAGQMSSRTSCRAGQLPSSSQGHTTPTQQGLLRLLEARYPAYNAAGGATERLFAYEPRLLQRAASRGLFAAGGLARLRRVVHKLLLGQPIKAQTVGGSISAGQGAIYDVNYVRRFHEWLRATFPNPQHRLQNAAFGGSGSMLFMTCAHHILAPDEELIVVEFAVNDGNDNGFEASKHMELLLRKLLQLPSRPAVIMLNAYSWILENEFKEPAPWAPFWGTSGGSSSMLSQFYDIPVLSMRSAVYPLMLRNVSNYVPHESYRGIQARVPDKHRADYFYFDSVHPAGETGHRFMGELLEMLVQATVVDLLQRPYNEGDEAAAQAQLLPPALELNYERHSSTCLLGRETEPVVVGSSGFELGDDGVNKWGWIATQPGAELLLHVDTRSGQDATSTPLLAQDNQVLLGFLHSYEHMGKAKVECVANCRCEPQAVDLTWEKKTSETELLKFQASQHEECKLRVTVLNDTSSNGYKVKLVAIMVSEGGLQLEELGFHVDKVW